MKGISMLLATLATNLTLTSGASSTTWEDYPGFQGPGHAGIVIGDFDGDGQLEAVVSGYAYSQAYYRGAELLAVLGSAAGERIRVRAISTLPARQMGALISAPPDGGADRLATLVGDGPTSQVVVLGGVPLRALRTIETPLLSRIGAVTDVDADGRLDIVGMMSSSGLPSDQYPVILDYETGAVVWVGSAPMTDIAVAQLDDDPAMEVLMAGSVGTPALIVDGATHAEEWSFPSGYQAKILVGQFGTDPVVAGFALSSRTELQIYRSRPYASIATLPAVKAASVVRLAAGGPDFIAYHEWGQIVIYDPSTGAAAFSMAEPATASTFAAGDIDSGGRTELVYGTGLDRIGKQQLVAVDLTTSAIDYRRCARRERPLALWL